jgi:hypothetical protein
MGRAARNGNFVAASNDGVPDAPAERPEQIPRSAKVFGGSGTPSGVCTVARRSAALRRVGLKLRMPSRAKVDFIRFTPK